VSDFGRWREGETLREWLSAVTALGRGRVVGGRPEKGSRLALKWPCRSGWRADEES
jgi:hypothetical protein